MVGRGFSLHTCGMENVPAATRTRVFIVEDSAPIRQRLAGLLNAIEGVSVVGEADSIQAAVEGILRTRPESVLLDIRLIDGSGIDVLREVHPLAPEVAFVVLTNNATPQYRRICMEAGASHFLDKTTEFARVRQIVAGLGASSAPDISKLDQKENAMGAAATLALFEPISRDAPRDVNPPNIARVPTKCSSCNLRELCLP